MRDILDDIAARLRRHTLDDAIALLRAFLTGPDEHQHKRFLALIRERTPALGSVSETIDWDDAAGLLQRIYALAARYCTVIRSIRRLQGRPADFDHYYQGLLVTYTRYAALKDELRTAIEGSGYKRTRR